MIPELLNWIGSHWGRQHDALVCENCEWEDPTDTFVGDYCPSCDQRDTLVYAVTNGELWELRYSLWRSGQRWLPQRYYRFEYDKPGGIKYVWWWGRKWHVRPWEGFLD